MTPPVLEIVSLAKQYGGLRPLRIERLTVLPDDVVALLGFDQAAAETLTALVTGVTLPDTGEVSLFGRPTTAIHDSDAWLTHIDQIGVVAKRAVLLESLSVVQNLSMPYTLQIEPPSEEILGAATALAAEAGVPAGVLAHPLGRLDREVQFRVRLARALALGPRLLILEHPTADLGPAQARVLASDLRAIASRRRLSVLLLTVDAGFAAAAATRVLSWEPATGRFQERRPGSWFFGRR